MGIVKYYVGELSNAIQVRVFDVRNQTIIPMAFIAEQHKTIRRLQEATTYDYHRSSPRFSTRHFP